jgi:hypothetical protein
VQTDQQNHKDEVESQKKQGKIVGGAAGRYRMLE